ncbi:monocarboxylate transporter [Ophiocordyceps camponoti-floridani]|uniref:Monocarboxylate transporter n=1 Tax=Ophiocordyceps camponoti-floridani TaxID=2030778 RepID=A0A8H4QB11_9HYPO|nr:monocarboxylate transporter [Ophiocordyceps camponoti-floridani]
MATKDEDVSSSSISPATPTEEALSAEPKDQEAAVPEQQLVDGPRGWIVVAAASCSLFCYMGCIYSWGIVQVQISQTTSMTLPSLTFVGSLGTSFMASISPFVGKAIRRFGYRNTALAGAFLLGLGEMLSSWVTYSLPALLITHGCLFGIGGGMTILPLSTAPLKWFKKHRGLAVGVVFGGSSLGAAMVGVATNFLVRSVGVPWTFRILGLILWSVCLPAAFFIGPPSSKDLIPRLQWHRWTEPDFLLLFTAGAISCFPVFVPPYFIPVFARSISHSSSTGIIALTIWNMSSTVGRVVAGLMADSFLGPINSLCLAIFLCSISALAVWPFASSIGILSLFTVISGTGCGAFFSLFPTVVSAVFGPENTLGVLPMLWAGWFFGYFFGTPIASRLYALAAVDADTSEYRPAAFYAGATSFIGLVFLIALRYRRNSVLLARV